MKPGTIAITVLAVSCTCGTAEDKYEATVEYVREMFATEDFRIRWEPRAWEGHVSERNDPVGGYVFRHELTIAPDEAPYVFLGTDRFGERGWCAWNIYHRSDGRTLRKLATSVILSIHQFHLDRENRTIIEHYPERRDIPMSYSSLHLDPDGTLTREYFKGDETDAETRERLKNAGEVFTPAVEKIPIAAFLKAPGAEWRLLGEYGISAQSLDPGDAELLSSAAGLTWEDASNLMEKLPARQPGPQPQPEPDTPTPTPDVHGGLTETSFEKGAGRQVPLWAVTVVALVLLTIVLVASQRSRR